MTSFLLKPGVIPEGSKATSPAAELRFGEPRPLGGAEAAWEAGISQELTVAVGESAVLFTAGRSVRGQARDGPAEHLLVRRLQDKLH